MLLSQRKFDVLFSVLPLLCMLMLLGEVIFFMLFLKHVACECEIREQLVFY